MVLKKSGKKRAIIVTVLLILSVTIISLILLFVYRSNSLKQITKAIENDDTILLRELCQKPFADVDGKRPLSDFLITVLDGITDEKPLKLAIRKGNPEMVKILAESGADINYRGPYKRSYYMDTAICWGKADIVSILADKNAKSRGEYYCLVILAQSVQREAIDIEDYKSTYEVLLNSGRIKTDEGEQLWDGLCSYCCLAVFQYYLTSGTVDVDYRFSDGASFLHRCASAKDDEDNLMEFATMLLNNGIDTSIRDCDGNTAWDLAKRRGLTRLASLFNPKNNQE